MSRARVVPPQSTWGWVALACAASLGTAGALAASGTGHNPVAGAVLGVLAALLAVLALPSIPTRASAAVILALGGVVVVRHVRRPGAGLLLVGVWALATLVALVLVDRADVDDRPRLSGGSPLPVLGREVVAATAILAIVVLLVGALLAPALGHRPPPRLGSGGIPRYDISGPSGSPLLQNDHLDTTERPHLGDDVVMTVTASRPEFWRGETFDEWTGSAWFRSSSDAATQLDSIGNVAPVPRPAGVPPTGGKLLSQTFHLDATAADVIFGAAEPVQVESAGAQLFERPDGTIVSRERFGEGASYRVVSRVPDATAATLRAADSQPVPETIAAQYAQPPIATARVRSLAAQVTRDAPTTYDKVRALEAWMGAHVKYSLNAPLAHKGVDVVDDFLFNVREGWCEQISSSLVVMLRTLGIPAREATGFVPGEESRFSNEWVVREKDAHAWAEVYFPGVGWQAFDPTAHVALAGDAKGSESIWAWIGHHLLPLGGLVVLLGLGYALVVALQQLVARRRARRSRSWAARCFDELERLGAGAGRERRPSESALGYAHALARALGDAELVSVGAAIDTDTFSPEGIDPRERASIDALLAGIKRRPRDS